MKSPIFLLITIILGFGGAFFLESYQKRHIPALIMLENAVYIHGEGDLFHICTKDDTFSSSLLRGILKWPLSMPKITKMPHPNVFCQENSPENPPEEALYEYAVFFTSDLPENIIPPQKMLLFPPKRTPGKQILTLGVENSLPIISGKDFAVLWEKDGDFWGISP